VEGKELSDVMKPDRKSINHFEQTIKKRKKKKKIPHKSLQNKLDRKHLL